MKDWDAWRQRLAVADLRLARVYLTEARAVRADGNIALADLYHNAGRACRRAAQAFFSKSAVCLLAVAMLGCTTLSRGEKDLWRDAQMRGVREVQVCSPGLAAGLNILPGVGNAYIAGSGGPGSEWAWFAINFLTWPISPIWAIPDGAISAKTVNVRETLYIHRLAVRPQSHKLTLPDRR